LVVIPNGIDVDRFSNVTPLPIGKIGVPPDRRMILYVARLEPDKRPDWLLDRMPEIARRLTQHDLVVAGCGPLGAALQRRAAQLGVAERVHFVGWRADVPSLLASADLLVLTSSSEGMPNVILEAMASARPVVATEVHGALELLGVDHDGQITPADDPQAFVDAVVRIGGDDNLAHRLGQRNRGRAQELFSFDRTVGSYATLYDSLLAAKTR
jgi:glycosyltransferase involved in cell wall biosynthesis